MKPGPSLAGLALAAWVTLGAVAHAEITTANDARPVGDGRWVWTVFIQASPAELRSIECVVYTLHPTFPDPVQRVCTAGDPQRAFAFTANGWGTFAIDVVVHFRDRREQRLRHMLSFIREDRRLPVRAANVAKETQPGVWTWTIYVEGPVEALDRIRCVEYTLHPTFPDPVRRVCSRGTGGRGFPLTTSGWGTFEVQLRLMLRDGRTEDLRHQLRF